MLFPPAVDAYGGAVERSDLPELRLLGGAGGTRPGVGQALVDECVRRARASGAAALGLHTSESMRVAIRMYRGWASSALPSTTSSRPAPSW
jgi:hypothetical protein